MARFRMISAILGLAASIVLPPSAQAHDDHFGRAAPYAYAPPVWGYEFAAPYPYYGRDYRRAEKRAEREFKRQAKREAKAYKKLRRAYERYESRYGYPYVFDPGLVPYRLAGDYRYFRRFKHDEDGDWDDD